MIHQQTNNNNLTEKTSIPNLGKEGIRLALGSKSRTGKDTVGALVLQEFGGLHLSFASALYDIARFTQSRLHQPVEKNPLLLQKQGESLKEVFGRDIWARCVEEEVSQAIQKDPQINIIITDLRFPEEWDILARYNFKTVRVNRKDRPITRDPTHISEVALDTRDFDYVLENDGNLEDLKEKAFHMLNHFGWNKSNTKNDLN